MTPLGSTGLGPALHALLNPASVAIVGASPREDSLGGRPIVNLRRQGFTGTILPINPRHERIGELRCYPDLLALPEAPDVVLVLVGSDRVPTVLEQCVQVGARTAILFAGGFAEVGEDGAALQRHLKSFSERGLRICGPNCNGIFNVGAGIAMGFSPSFELPPRLGHVAMIAQSGAIATGVSSRGMETGLGFSHVVATGNEADLEVSDFVEHLIDDPQTRTFALFVEGFKNPTRFLRVAEMALARGKPITLLKVGRSASGQRVALSHTGSMAGSYDVLVGALRQRGVIVACELDDLLGLAAVFAGGRRPRSGALAIASLSGGMAALSADQCEATRQPLAEFAAGTRATIAAALPDIANLANPLDVTGSVVNDVALWTTCLGALNADPGVDAVLSILSLTANRSERHFAADVAAASRAAEAPLQLAVWTSAAPAGSGIELLRDAGVPVYQRCKDAVDAVAAWRRYWTTRETRLDAVREAAALAADAPGAANEPTSGPAPSAWQLLHDAGIETARQFLARSREEMQRELTRVRFPVAVKVESAAVAHKSELGLVRLSVMSAADALGAYDELHTILAERLPGVAIDGVRVQEMVTGRRELILGVRREPALGAAVVLGHGGIFSEVHADISIRLAPLAPADVHDMLAELRTRALFDGVRGLAPVQMQRFVDLVVRFSLLALRHADTIDELEINPLILADDGASFTAVDVLMAPAVPMTAAVMVPATSPATGAA